MILFECLEMTSSNYFMVIFFSLILDSWFPREDWRSASIDHCCFLLKVFPFLFISFGMDWRDVQLLASNIGYYWLLLRGFGFSKRGKAWDVRILSWTMKRPSSCVKTGKCTLNKPWSIGHSLLLGTWPIYNL